MAFKLVKDEEVRLGELQNAVTAAYGNLESAVEEYNEELAELKGPVEQAMAAYNEALGELRAFATTTAEVRRSEYEDKTESWQEGVNGQLVDEWITAWEDADLEAQSISYPDDLQVSFENHSDEIDLPLEPQ